VDPGASGFLLARTQPEQLIVAIHTIAAGESLLSPSIGTLNLRDRVQAAILARETGPVRPGDQPTTNR
jgi:hypothetical protein